LCTEQEPWLDLQGLSAGTAAGLDVDASRLAALFNVGYESEMPLQQLVTFLSPNRNTSTTVYNTSYRKV